MTMIRTNETRNEFLYFFENKTDFFYSNGYCIYTQRGLINEKSKNNS